MNVPCPLCNGSARDLGTQRVLGRHDVAYAECTSCRLIFTEKPYWLAEAYAHAISQLDTGAVERNQICARLTLMVSAALGLSPHARCLDFGGGHGVFVRMMRDRGLDFSWYDAHAENLYARGFEGTPDQPSALVTAFEVVEHFAEPAADWARVFAARPETVLVGTVLHHGHEPGWWYYLLESGQHVAFYAVETMSLLADRFGYEVEAGPEYTLFLRRDRAPSRARRALLRRLIAHPAIALQLSSLIPPALWSRLLPYRSRLMADFAALSQRVSGRP